MEEINRLKLEAAAAKARIFKEKDDQYRSEIANLRQRITDLEEEEKMRLFQAVQYSGSYSRTDK